MRGRTAAPQRAQMYPEQLRTDGEQIGSHGAVAVLDPHSCATIRAGLILDHRLLGRAGVRLYSLVLRSGSGFSLAPGGGSAEWVPGRVGEADRYSASL